MTERTVSRRPGGRTAEKERAILAAAEEVFLRDGYADASMDEIASLAGASKQTVYAHFGNKELLFVELVSAMTKAAGAGLHDEPADPTDPEDLEEFLVGYGLAQLHRVLSPRIVRLRRLVIGEVGRFPALAKVLWDAGPALAMAAMAERFGRLDRAGLLLVPDPPAAARSFNWMVMGEPLNRAMLLEAPPPTRTWLRQHVAESVRVFLAGYARGH
ncbi:TetR family transcriptional regulator [Nakamurella sp. YIM 132087]|uniref:TetR family transcriptional regulator n=1 Tax=Nakamurella alba TaxID=2665158 RepID=A0A7K1FRY2_9ACTN|nr:TetR/AcrR family transcriptional regulator [Nakamurella alba]MTD16830.1 TetR family transcriptional regulator [Nakamurella alba]